MIKALTFDLWCTLLKDSDYGEHRIRIIAQILNKRGFSVDKQKITKAYESAIVHFNELWKKDKENQYISAAKVVDFILAKIGVEVPLYLWKTIVAARAVIQHSLSHALIFPRLFHFPRLGIYIFQQPRILRICTDSELAYCQRGLSVTPVCNRQLLAA